MLASLNAPDSHSIESLIASDAHEWLADALNRQLVSLLDDLLGDGPDKILKQLELVKELIGYLRSKNRKTIADLMLIENPARVLRSIRFIRSSELLFTL